MAEDELEDLKIDVAGLVTAPSGRVPVLERRVDDHAKRIKGLEQQNALLPCNSNVARLVAVERKTDRLMWMAACLVGGGAVLIWMIDRCIRLLELWEQIQQHVAH